MHIPRKVPGLKLARLLLGVYFVAWVSLEGNLARVVALALGVALVGAGHGVQRTLGGRRLTPAAWLALAATLGLLIGGGTALLALLFMAVKSGLHAHGPEFSLAEIGWLLAHLPWWTAGGGLAGLGLGLMALVKRGDNSEL